MSVQFLSVAAVAVFVFFARTTGTWVITPNLRASICWHWLLRCVLTCRSSLTLSFFARETRSRCAIVDLIIARHFWSSLFHLRLGTLLLLGFAAVFAGSLFARSTDGNLGAHER